MKQKVERTSKICGKCFEEKLVDEFYFNITRNCLTSYCKPCIKLIKTEKDKKIQLEEGFKRIRQQPNTYNDENERKLTFELLNALGWIFNEENGIWYKPGIKNPDGTWNFKPKIKKKKEFDLLTKVTRSENQRKYRQKNKK